MRRLIESGACRGDRFLQIGLRGYWPEPETLGWMAEQGMRSFEMTEVVAAGLDAVLDEAFAIATDDCDAVFLSVDVDVVDPGSAPGHRHARARRARARASCSTPCGASPWSCPLGGHRRGRGLAALRPRRDHGLPGEPGRPRGALGGIAWRRRKLAGEARAPPGDPLLEHRRPARGLSEPLSRAWCRGSRGPGPSSPRGAGRRSGRSVSPSHFVGVTKAIWSREQLRATTRRSRRRSSRGGGRARRRGSGSRTSSTAGCCVDQLGGSLGERRCARLMAVVVGVGAVDAEREPDGQPAGPSR